MQAIRIMLIVLFAASGWIVAQSSFVSQPKPGSAASARLNRDAVGVAKKLCVSCHSGKSPSAGFALDKILADSPQKRSAEWKKILSRVSAGTMPPPGSKTFTVAQRNAFIRAGADFFGDQDCRIVEPGRVTLRRLNRAEYDNTIRDLFGLEISLSEDFPSDDVGHGFDNIGDVLSVSPLLVEKYLDAAETIVNKAIVNNQMRSIRLDAASMSDGEGHRLREDGARVMFTNAEVGGDVEIPQDGRYIFRVQAWGQQAGPEPCQMAIRIEAQTVDTVAVKGVEGKPQTFELPVNMTRGTRRVSAAFKNDYYNPKEPNPSDRDRNLIVGWIEVVGPLDLQSSLPASHRKWIPQSPVSGQGRETARGIVGKFASRAYRRPVSAVEIDKLMSLYDLAIKEKESFERGIQLAFTGALVSPQFLFRAEAGGPRALNGYEMASRLSYFLWSSMPDEDLFEAAARGELLKPAGIVAQAMRMIRNPKSRALGENFASQWLQLRKLALVSPDPEMFPDFNDSLRESMRKETLAFFDYVLKEDRPVMEFLDAKYTFIDKNLAVYYKLPMPSEAGFVKVDQGASGRRGILTQGSVLTVTSNPNRTSPVKRGKWILENILGTPPPPPPPGVGDLSEKKEDVVGMTLKKRMEVHRKDPSCSSCHARMDAFGIALESFDAIGRKRDLSKEVDDRGTLPDGKIIGGYDGLQAMLVAQRQQFIRCLGEKLLTYALGRGLTLDDDCVLDAIVKNARSKQYKMSSLIEAIVTSDAFRKIGT